MDGEEQEPDTPTISQAEYDSWIVPPKARDTLRPSHGFDGNLDAIRRGLWAGEIRSAARRVIVRENYRQREEVCPFELHSSIWSKPPVNISNFWQDGAHTFIMPKPGGYGRETEMECFGIRFDPAGIDQILIDAGVLVTPAETVAANSVGNSENGLEKLPRIADEEAKRFVELYLGIWSDDAKELRAWAAAKAAYPENSVGRDFFLSIFRELRGAGKRGNPQFAKKS